MQHLHHAFLASTLLGLAPALPGQQPLTLRPLAHPTPPIAGAWDSARQTTVLLTNDGVLRHWDWDGSTARERLGVVPSMIVYWLGNDPRRGELVALTSTGTARWNGARWTVRSSPSWPALTMPYRACFDEHRGRIVVAKGVGAAMELHEWDGSQWWSPTPTAAPAARLQPGFAYDPIGRRSVLFGGEQGGTASGDGWSWDGSAWTQIAVPAQVGPRSAPSLAFAPAIGGLLLYGGSASLATWRLAGATWSAVPTAHDPGPRAGAQLVQDAHGLLLVGGTADPSGLSWRFTGADWINTGTTFVAPDNTTFGAAAYDRARGFTVLHGGLSQREQTLLFDDRWHAPMPTHLPPPRNGAQMAFSSVEQEVLLFGGIDAVQLLGDTWSWTGSDWVQRSSPMAPSPRHSAQVAEDPLGGVLLFGGTDGVSTFGDHWHWNGSLWVLRTPAVRPSPRAGCFAALDPLRQRVVAVGPLMAGSLTTETWEWDGAAWSLAATSPLSVPIWNGRVVFEPRLGQVVAPGSTSFAWNGQLWTAVPTSGATSALYGSVGFVTDTARQRALSIGRGVSLLTPTPATATTFGAGCAFGPSPALHAITDPQPGSADFALDVATLAAAAPTFLALGFLPQNLPLGHGCTMLVGTAVATRAGTAGPDGLLRFPLPMPNAPSLRGVEFVAQAAVWNPPQSLLGSATLTAGLRITIGD